MAQPQFTTRQVSVDDDPAVVLSQFSGGNFLQRTFQNLGPNTLWLGGEDVTPETGIRVYPGETWTDGATRSSWLGICDTGENTVIAVFEETSPVGHPPILSSGLGGTPMEGFGTVYKVYRALLTQSGTDAPIATVLQNTLGFTPIWLRLTEGEYSVAFSNGFPDNDKIFTIFPATYFDGGDVQTILMVSPNSPNSVAFHFFDTMEASKDAECFRLPVEIRVYP